ncbi:hypothetical protein BKA69DRAFT_1078466 [Paraphysoderma sedebokerense]|nr:hypothetical protein BKA69DRAFT_1078466 [Paraphysoderma sedebokerense]
MHHFGSRLFSAVDIYGLITVVILTSTSVASLLRGYQVAKHPHEILSRLSLCIGIIIAFVFCTIPLLTYHRDSPVLRCSLYNIIDNFFLPLYLFIVWLDAFVYSHSFWLNQYILKSRFTEPNKKVKFHWMLKGVLRIQSSIPSFPALFKKFREFWKPKIDRTQVDRTPDVEMQTEDTVESNTSASNGKESTTLLNQYAPRICLLDERYIIGFVVLMMTIFLVITVSSICVVCNSDNAIREGVSLWVVVVVFTFASFILSTFVRANGWDYQGISHVATCVILCIFAVVSVIVSVQENSDPYHMVRDFVIMTALQSIHHVYVTIPLVRDLIRRKQNPRRPVTTEELYDVIWTKNSRIAFISLMARNLSITEFMFWQHYHAVLQPHIGYRTGRQARISIEHLQENSDGTNMTSAVGLKKKKYILDLSKREDLSFSSSSFVRPASVQGGSTYSTVDMQKSHPHSNDILTRADAPSTETPISNPSVGYLSFIDDFHSLDRQAQVQWLYNTYVKASAPLRIYCIKKTTRKVIQKQIEEGNLKLGIFEAVKSEIQNSWMRDGGFLGKALGQSNGKLKMEVDQQNGLEATAVE